MHFLQLFIMKYTEIEEIVWGYYVSVLPRFSKGQGAI